MLKPKLLLLIFSTLLSEIITAQTTFNKKFFLGAGGQLSIYNRNRTFFEYLTNEKIESKNTLTNYGISAELGYFILRNFSASLQSTFQEWSSETSSSKSTINSFHNGIALNKMFLVKNDLFFNLGITPFYEKIYYTPSVILDWTSEEKSESRTNHGAIFNVGFAFAVHKNSIVNIGLYRKFGSIPVIEESVKSGMVVSYRYVFNNKKDEGIGVKDHAAHTPQKRKLNLLIGANINNPHQLIEGTKSQTDYSSFRDGNQNSYGNIFLGILYKNKWQLSLSQELNEKNIIGNSNIDYILNARYYFLNDSFYFNPYAEIGTIIATNAGGEIKNQKSIQFSAGFIYKINPIISFDFGLSLLTREYNISGTQFARPPFTFNNDVTYNRFMMKTGLIFKIVK
jgi:hypothetical protein